MSSAEDLLERARIVLKEKQGWSDQIQSREVTIGATNRSFVLHSSSSYAFVRLFRVPTPAGVDRKVERTAYEMAARAGISPPLLHADDEMLISEFVEGTNLIPLAEEDIPLAVELNRKVHSLPLELRVFNPWEVLECQLQRLTLKVAALEGPIQRVLGARQWIEERLEQIPKSFSHNDFHGGNLLKTDRGELFLIDWEYGGVSFELYDLARFVTFHQLEKGKCRELLSLYLLRAPLRQEEHGFFLLYILSVLSSIVWLKARIGEGHPLSEEFQTRLPPRIRLLDELAEEYLKGELFG